MLTRCYLRASTDEQNASRARNQVEAFAAERGLVIASTYVENESGAKLARPELFRLIADSRPGAVLLIEQVDRLSRLTATDWQKLRADLDQKQIRVVALDLPTSWMLAAPADEFTARMFGAVNGMMLDVLAAVARRIMTIAVVAKPKDRPKPSLRANIAVDPKTQPDAGIASMLKSGDSWTAIEGAFGCSRATIAKIAKRVAKRVAA